MPPLPMMSAAWAGGALGASARYLLVDAGPDLPTTLVINVFGALLLGVLVARVPDRGDPRRVLLGTGVLGGFTTTSALAVQTLDAGPVTGTASLLATLVLGVAAARWGLRR